MSASSVSTWQRAKTALRNGRHAEARALLQQLVREEPNNALVWLWLASVTPSVKQAAAYVQRAEMLEPDHPQVHKARAWIEKRQRQAAAPPTPTPSQQRKRPFPAASWRANWRLLALRAGMGLAIIVMLAAAAWLLWQHALPPTAVASPQTVQRRAAAPLSPTPTQPPPTATPQQVAAKRLTQNSNPRPTWTTTPTPTLTPTPTPTVQPTAVIQDYTGSGIRPYGVATWERWIDVNLSTQTLTAYEGDTAVFTTRVSTGTWQYPTVTGQFRIWLRYISQDMDGFRLGYDYFLEDVPHVMYFYEDYAIHGAYWHNNFGTPMSHGCVNVHPDDAKWLYDFARLGTLVNVHH